MTVNVGEIRSGDRVSPATQTFTHVNGAATELELWMGGPVGKHRLPICVLLCTPGATYHLVYNERDQAGDEIEDSIIVDAAATTPYKLHACPHQLHSDSTNGAIIICRY